MPDVYKNLKYKYSFTGKHIFIVSISVHQGLSCLVILGIVREISRGKYFKVKLC